MDLRKVRVQGPTGELTDGWFHRWVDRKVHKKVPGYDTPKESWVPVERVWVTQALVEQVDGSMIYVDPNGLLFDDTPEEEDDLATFAKWVDQEIEAATDAENKHRWALLKEVRRMVDNVKGSPDFDYD